MLHLFPLAEGEHVWVPLKQGRVLEYVAVSPNAALDPLGTEIAIDLATCIRSSPHASFVQVQQIGNKPTRVWVLDSDTHQYVGGMLNKNNLFVPHNRTCSFYLCKEQVVSTKPVYLSGLENGHVWTITQHRLMIVHVHQRVIVCSRPLWNLPNPCFLKTYLGDDSECEFTLNALMEMNGFSFV